MLERLLKFSIEHRFLVVMLVVLAAALGVFSLARLPIDAVPDITNNQVQVNTVFPSYSPAEVETRITYPVERALAGIPGLQYTRSISRNGFSQVQAVFDDDVDVYFARQQVAQRLTDARESLPDGAEPTMGPVATGLGEVYWWVVEYEHPDGKGAPVAADGQPGWQADGSYLTPEGQRLTTEVERAAYLRTVQDWVIRPAVQGVKDVAGVDAIGGYVKQYQVRPDPMKLVGYGLSFRDVTDALEKNNASAGAGYVERHGESYLVRAYGLIENADQIAEVAVAVRNGTPVRVRDVATVAVGGEPRTGSASANGQEVVAGTALMLIGANSRTVAAAVDQKMAVVRKTLPPDVVAPTVLDRTKLVNATVRTVTKNLAEGAILVVVVLFLLLGNVRAALIAALAIPLAMLLTASGMVQGRISGNLMSLGAIDFGLIVDGAVIVVENCLRRLAERQHLLGRTLTRAERLAEVTSASKEMIRPSVFGQAIIVTVYVPILTLTGVEGKMFKPMALTVILALVAACVLSLTFVPAMVALVVRGRVRERENWLIRLAKGGYRPVVRWAVRGRWAVVPLAAVVFAASCLLFTRLGREFVPTLDEQDLAIEGLRIPSTSLTQSTRMQQDVERTLGRLPEVAFVLSKIGTAELASDPMGPNSADTFIILKPREQWPDPHEPKDHLIKRMEAALGGLPGNLYEFTQPIEMRFNELIAGVRSDVAVKVYGDDFPEMLAAGRQIADVLDDVRGAVGVKIEQTEGQPLMNLRIDPRAIARHGLTVADVQDVIRAAVGGRPAGQIFEGDRRFDLVVRLPDEVRESTEAIESLPVPLPRGADAGTAPEPVRGAPAPKSLSRREGGGSGDRPGFVPLGALLVGGHVEVTEGPNQVSRENGRRRVVVQCNVRDRDLGSFVDEAQRRIGEKLRRPAGSPPLDWGGQFENLQAAQRRLTVVVPLCLFLIFVLLFTTFNSVKHALLVFSGVPLALTGGIVALWMRAMPFSISAAVGFIALSGVAVLNGLVMVTFINGLREDGVGLDESIIRGSLTRLRPVLMTALVAALGFVPMALATGTGAEVQKPLATVVIGGIVSSTLLTLVVLPSLYRMFHWEVEPKEPADVGRDDDPAADRRSSL